jgi:hypothetical protein
LAKGGGDQVRSMGGRLRLVTDGFVRRLLFFFFFHTTNPILGDNLVWEKRTDQCDRAVEVNIFPPLRVFTYPGGVL